MAKLTITRFPDPRDDYDRGRGGYRDRRDDYDRGRGRGRDFDRGRRY